MARVPRIYDAVLVDHLERHRQMALFSGPRQVGKTTTCREAVAREYYLNWDDQDDRRLITRGARAVVESLGLERLGAPTSPILVFDELHKYSRWRTFLKGFFDKYSDRLRIVVTGSARMDVYRRGGDSLMGRYLLYRMHPLTIGELLAPTLPAREVRLPKKLAATKYDALFRYGGFPEPYTKRDPRFARRWRSLRVDQLVRGDVRDLTRIQELSQLSVLVEILGERSACQLSYASLAREVSVSVDTARRWVGTLTALHHGFLVRPWFRNVAKALRKEPKWYLRDWSGIADPGQRAETFVACHLRKAVELWEDLGFGRYELRYLRDKAKREVDFAIVRDGKPWFLVEVKQAQTKLSPALGYFQEQTGALHAYQAVIDLPWIEHDCFTRSAPCVVPASTLLSQLP